MGSLYKLSTRRIATRCELVDQLFSVETFGVEGNTGVPTIEPWGT